MSLRTEVGGLLEALRGPLSRSAMARELGMTRQGVMGLERGIVSLERLEQLQDVYGVRFQIIALDAVTGLPVTVGPRTAELAKGPAAASGTSLS